MSADAESATASKSSQKRQMNALKKLAEALVKMPDAHLEKLPDPELTEAVLLAKKIIRGSARKRQIQFVARQLGQIDLAPVREALDQLHAGSAAHTRHFHQIENWRDDLIAGVSGEAKNLNETLNEILALHPDADRQHLRQLARNAAKEMSQDDESRSLSRVHYRKLFQYLKSL